MPQCFGSGDPHVGVRIAERAGQGHADGAGRRQYSSDVAGLVPQARVRSIEPRRCDVGGAGHAKAHGGVGGGQANLGIRISQGLKSEGRALRRAEGTEFTSGRPPRRRVRGTQVPDYALGDVWPDEGPCGRRGGHRQCKHGCKAGFHEGYVTFRMAGGQALACTRRTRRVHRDGEQSSAFLAVTRPQASKPTAEPPASRAALR